jgi:hypothetical protein
VWSAGRVFGRDGKGLRVESEKFETAPGEVAWSKVAFTSNSKHGCHTRNAALQQRCLGHGCQATGLTRRSSGRAKAGFAIFVPPLNSNVRQPE